MGLGYVGLPVATAFGKERRTIGYDLSRKRIDSLRHQLDATGEVSLTSHGIAARESMVTDRLSLDVPGPTPHLLTGQDRGWRTLPTDNVLSGSLAGVAEVTVDLDHAGLSLEDLELRVTTDGPVTVHLLDGEQRTSVELR